MCVNFLFNKPLINGNYYYGECKVKENPFLTLRNLKTIRVYKVYIWHTYNNWKASKYKQVHGSM